MRRPPEKSGSEHPAVRCIRGRWVPHGGAAARLGATTLLPYQLLLFAEAEGQPALCLSDRFYVENYEVSDGNPYAFDLPDYTVRVTDFGAFGDAIHNDTDAIQRRWITYPPPAADTLSCPAAPDRYVAGTS